MHTSAYKLRGNTAEQDPPVQQIIGFFIAGLISAVIRLNLFFRKRSIEAENKIITYGLCSFIDETEKSMKVSVVRQLVFNFRKKG